MHLSADQVGHHPADRINPPSSAVPSCFTGGFLDSMLEFTGYAVQSFTAALKLVIFSKATVFVENPFKDMPEDTLKKVFGGGYLKWAAVPKIDLAEAIKRLRIWKQSPGFFVYPCCGLFGGLPPA